MYIKTGNNSIQPATNAFFHFNLFCDFYSHTRTVNVFFQTQENHRFEIPTKKRVYFTPEQRDQLEELYKSKQYPTRSDKSALAKTLNIDENKIQVWFQNRRARDRNVF